MLEQRDNCPLTYASFVQAIVVLQTTLLGQQEAGVQSFPAWFLLPETHPQRRSRRHFQLESAPQIVFAVAAAVRLLSFSVNLQDFERRDGRISQCQDGPECLNKSWLGWVEVRVHQPDFLTVPQQDYRALGERDGCRRKRGGDSPEYRGKRSARCRSS